MRRKELQCLESDFMMSFGIRCSRDVDGLLLSAIRVFTNPELICVTRTQYRPLHRTFFKLFKVWLGDCLATALVSQHLQGIKLLDPHPHLDVNLGSQTNDAQYGTQVNRDA